MRKRRLLYRLFLSYLWITIAVVILGGFYGAHLMRQFHLDRTERDLEARARLCSKQILALVADNRSEEINLLCKELGKSPGINTRFTVILPDGTVVGDTAEDPRHMDNHRDRPEVREAIASDRHVGSSSRYSDTTKEERMYVAAAFAEDGQQIAVIRTSLPLTAIKNTIAELYRRIALAGILATAVIAAVSLGMSRRISRPIEEIRAGAERFATGELSYRLPASDSEEIAALSETMNDMASRLNEHIHAVRRQQSELEAMLVSMDEGVVAVDLNGRILSLNEAFADLLQEDATELRGRIVHEVIRKPDLLEFVESALSSDKPIEKTLELRDTEDTHLRARGTALIDASKQRMGALVVLYDITQLLRVEKVRRDFVANVSHELGTPITAIKGFVESLLDGAMEDHGNARRFLHIVLKQVDRLDAMADDLLTLSRLESEAEQRPADLKLGSVQQVLHAAVQTCMPLAADHGVKIELLGSEDLAANIDAVLLERALTNLIDNAVKYSDPGASVRVVAEREGDEIVIHVKDHGRGIAANHLPRLFERFYRVDKARSREEGGTGLGLAIVKHIATLHHGAVDVRSTLGSGSTFTIRLPQAEYTDAV